jgi:hypothetical protein
MNIRPNRKRAVTIVELLVVLLIIALLGTIAVPVYISRIQTARIRSAQAEVRELAQTEDICAAIHGFYVPLQVLDDVATIGGITDSERSDDIQQEPAGVFVYKISVPLAQQIGNQPLLEWGVLGSTEFDMDIYKMRTQWQGPFVNFHHFFMGEAGGMLKTSIADSEPEEIRRDFPLDPWGQPYRIYSPVGITVNDPAATLITPNTPENWNNDSTFNLEMIQWPIDGAQDPYDRFAIVSFGPDQTPYTLGGATPEQVDDIVYFFGFVGSETLFVMP